MHDLKFQGNCAFLLGLAITHNDNTVAACTQEKLLQLVEKRIGAEIFMDKVTNNSIDIKSTFSSDISYLQEYSNNDKG